MLYICISLIVLCVFWDINYVLRTYFSVLSGRIYQKQFSLNDVTVIYGMGTFQDCDIHFKNIRLARLIREIDFARYHFYDRTGIYKRSKILGIKSLQGCTLTITLESVPIFKLYKIKTKLVHWDERSLFFEHEVVTLPDGKVRHRVVSRQYAIGTNGDTTKDLLKGLFGAENKPNCPEYIDFWLNSMKVSSAKLNPALQ